MKIIGEIREKLGAGYEVEEISVTKNNGSVRTGISIRKEDDAIAPTIYIDDNMTADDVIKIYNKCDKPDIDTKGIFTKEYVLKNVFPCLVNSEANSDRNDLVNEQCANLNILFRVKVHIDDNLGSFLICNNHLTALDIEKQELVDAAIANIQDCGVVNNMFDVLNDVVPMPMPAPDDYTPKMYVITSKYKYYGAGMILDKTVRDKLSEVVGECFIIPLNVHELIAVPKSYGEVLEIVKIIRDINRTQISREEYLSDNLYEIVNDKLDVVA